jgi:hypothetical protein
VKSGFWGRLIGPGLPNTSWGRLGTVWELFLWSVPIRFSIASFGSEKRVVIWVGLCFLALVKSTIYAGFAISQTSLKSRLILYFPQFLCWFKSLEFGTSNPSVGGSNPPRRASIFNRLSNYINHYSSLSHRYGQHFAGVEYLTTRYIFSWPGADHPQRGPYSERPPHNLGKGHALRGYFFQNAGIFPAVSG